MVGKEVIHLKVWFPFCFPSGNNQKQSRALPKVLLRKTKERIRAKTKAQPCMVFNFSGYLDKDQEKLRKCLYLNFNLDTRFHKTGKYQQLYIPTRCPLKIKSF